MRAKRMNDVPKEEKNRKEIQTQHISPGKNCTCSRIKGDERKFDKVILGM